MPIDTAIGVDLATPQRRAAKMPAMDARRFSPKARVALFLAARGHCAACGAPLQPGWHGDHVKPVSAGGATEPANGQALCPRCNREKGAQEP